MFKLLRNCTLALAAVLLMATASKSNAQLLITFEPSLLSGQPGDEVIFSGTITNTSGSAVFLNNEDQTWSPASQGDPFTDDPGVFFGNVPGILNPGEFYTGAIFGLIISPGYNAGIYTGTSRILGGSDEFGTSVVGSKSFSVFVVPEPSTYVMIASGAVVFVAMNSKRRRRRD